MNILLIENEQFLAENLCQYLKKSTNLTIEYVTSAQRACQLVSQRRFDLVISDLWLDDARSNAWLLQLGELCPGQNVIIISSHPIPQQISSSDKLNIVDYFEKPFDMKEVSLTINRWIAENR